MKKTSWFAVFVAVLVGVTYYFEFYKATKEETQKNLEAKVISFAPDQINQLEVENKSGKIRLKRDTEGWRLEAPLEDWADNQFTEDFVNGLAAETSIDTVTAEGDLPWSVYGLDKDFSQVVFTNQQGKSILVQVSDKKNFEGNSFLRRDRENKVLVVTSQWALRSQKTLLDFRDKRFFRGKIGAVEGIHIKSPKDEFRLVNKENKWVSVEKPELKLDQNKVRELLTSLNEVRATEFLEKLPVASPRVKINLKLKDKSWSAEIKQGADKAIYGLVISDPVFNLKLDPGQTDKFLQLTLLGLRDRKEAFDFQNLLVRHIEVQTKLKKIHLVKEQETWRLEGDAKANIDQNAVRNFITRLSDTAVSEYLEKKDQGSFSNPENKLVLKDENQKVLFELVWGPVYKKKALVGENSLVLARSNLYKDIFGLDPSVIESWGLMGLLPVEQTKEKPQKDTP